MRDSHTKTLQPPTILGHRGIRGGGAIPENSIAAFLKAYKQGADGVELDVFLTKDDRLVVFHDDTLDRMTGTPGEIQDKTLEELQHLRLLNTTTGEKTEHGIPTLEKVLQELHKLRLDHQKDPRARDFKVNIEIKPMKAHADGQRKNIAGPVAALIKQQPNAKNSIVSSFDMDTLRAMKAADANIHRRMLICSPGDIERDCRYNSNDDAETTRISYRVQEKKDAAGNVTRDTGEWTYGRETHAHEKLLFSEKERVWDILPNELFAHLAEHKDIEPHSVALPISSITPEVTESVQKAGALLVVWTANERNPKDYTPEQREAYKNMRKDTPIDTIITDFPRGVRELLQTQVQQARGR